MKTFFRSALKCVIVMTLAGLTGGLRAGNVLRWDAAEGASTYVMEYRKDGSEVWSQFTVGTQTNLDVRMPAGVWYFRVVAVDKDGMRSPPSEEIIVEFDAQ